MVNGLPPSRRLSRSPRELARSEQRRGYQLGIMSGHTTSRCSGMAARLAATRTKAVRIASGGHDILPAGVLNRHAWQRHFEWLSAAGRARADLVQCGEKRVHD